MKNQNAILASEIARGAWWVKKNYLTPKKPTLSYVRYRVLRPLLKLYTKWQLRNYPVAPWTSPPSVAIFDQILNSTMTALEYGSGRSTIFFAERVGKLISIEHHSEWHTQVTQMLKQRNLANVDYRHIPQQMTGIEKSVVSSLSELKDKGFLLRMDYENYFREVLSFPDEHFDFILIDGRARVECFFCALPKLKKGGIIVLDNSERKRYKPIFEKVTEWEMVQTTNGLTDTTIWFKP